MKVLITENLRIDLDTERWECRACAGDLFDARDNYKRGLLVYDRDPREVHKPLLDPNRYEFTYAPNPAWCRILEYYCPHCGTMIETEYLPPGHPPVRDIELDLDVLKAQWKDRDEVKVAPVGKEPPRPHAHSHSHSHSHGGQPAVQYKGPGSGP